MAVKPKEDPILTKLDAILFTLQDLLILQARLAGIKRDKTRAIVGVGDARLTRIWSEVRSRDNATEDL